MLDTNENGRLGELEDQSIYVLREAYRAFPRLGMLWSMGKDSTVLVWLARKAFLGKVPFPLLHIDTTYKIPQMIEYRDAFVRAQGLDLIVGCNEAALAEGMGPEGGRVACCTALKTEALRQLISRLELGGMVVGIRRDEDGTRAKERVFSPRTAGFEWNYRDQPPEFWDQFQTHFGPDHHVRIHPILDWTELDVWRYIRREQIPIMDLYFSRNGRRYRSLGCAPCTGTIASNASTVDEIIEELEATRSAERAGRAQDREAPHAFEQLRTSGYM